MTTSVEHLSYELIEGILKCLSKVDLVAVSLVCQAWHATSFPLLYHTVNLTAGYPLLHFIQRVLTQERKYGALGKIQDGSGEDEGALRVAHYVRHLHLTQLSLGDEDLADFGQALLKLKKLEYLHWNPASEHTLDPDWCSVLTLIHEHLPTLHSLKLEIACDVFCSPEGYVQGEPIVALTNLRELSITFEKSVLYDWAMYALYLPPATESLITGASNIESLDLSFQHHEIYSHLAWVSDELLEALSKAYFPNLRSLRVHTREMGSAGHFDKHLLEGFISKHPRLCTIILDASHTYWSWATPPRWLTMTPGEISKLLPSVRHFEGPCAMVEAILESEIAQRIETLAIIEAACADRPVSEFLLAIISFRASLPRLKRFEIRPKSVTWQGILTGIQTFVSLAPEIEELVISGLTLQGITLEGLREFAAILGTLLSLRILGLSEPPSRVSEAGMHFFQLVGVACPRLQSIDYVSEGNLRGWWSIFRRTDQSIEVKYEERESKIMQPTRIPSGQGTT